MSALLQTTNEAEGLPRRRFTVDEVMEMTRAGILQEHDRIELIGGELVPMASKGSFHERMKTALNLHWARRLPPDLLFSTETTFRLSSDTYLEPDFVFYPRAGGWNALSPETARLAVEIADTSLRFDLGRKAEIYARFGIVELWVVNAVTRETRVHREPRPDGYGRVRDHGPDEALVPACAQALAVTLADLHLH
ncbi:MAG: Uma2 family endonuclease [Methylobacteriaceae bacterium]|nr:Uma2 family endonuclease [Methylobacteriaceae bacterium]